MAELPIMYDVSDSSNVLAFGYDEANRDFYVKFLNGSTYIYKMVEPDILDLFFAAPSKGKFVWQYLRDRYEYSRIA